jgi:hypothetical protein
VECGSPRAGSRYVNQCTCAPKFIAARPVEGNRVILGVLHKYGRSAPKNSVMAQPVAHWCIYNLYLVPSVVHVGQLTEFRGSFDL